MDFYFTDKIKKSQEEIVVSSVFPKYKQKKYLISYLPAA